jgi:pentatricopeptide repeat protein
MQFERPKENLAAISAAAISTKSEQETKASQTLEAHESLTADQQNQLLKRCRQVLRRYLSEEKGETTFVRKYSVPVMVADKVVDAVASASVSLDAPTLCMIMNAYVSCQKADRAIRLFEAAIGVSSDGSNDPVDVVISGAERGKLVRDAAALNLYTASSLLQALAATDDISSTKRVLAALQGKGGTVIDGKETAAWPGTGGNGSIVLDTTAYNIALASAAKNQRNVDSMLEIFNDMGDIKIASGGQPPKDVISYNTVIGGLSNAGKAADALDTFARMRKTGIKPDKYTFTSLVKACSHPNDMQELLYEMKDNGIKPDIVTYNTMIRTLCDRLQWYEAKNLINEMENSGIKPNSMTYGFLMTGLFKAKKFSACLSLFESACTDGRTAPLTENVHLYTTAISAAASLNNYEKAFNLVNRMKQAGVIPNLKTLTALLSACLSSEKTDLAVEVFKQISKPDNVAMSKGIEAMCYEGHFEEVMSTLYQQWRMRGSVMSGKEIVVGYDRLLRESLRQGRLETAKRAMTDFLRMGFIPSNQMLETIVDSLGLSPPQKNSAYAKKVPEEHFDYVLFVLDSLRARNLACDGNFYASILFCASRLGGLRRKIGSLMATARQSTMTNTNTLISETKGSEEIHSHRVGWMYLLHHYDECKEGGEVKLPSLRVNVAKSQVRRVLAADQSVSYGKKS